MSTIGGEMNTNTLESIQNRGLGILLVVDSVCKKNNINYYLDGGTLLGAIRHKGFIPWDDDVDIAMLRDDYEKFLNIAQAELGANYFLQTTKTDPMFPMGFARVIDNNAVFPDANRYSYKTGLCLDIFPIDNANDNRFCHRFNIFKIKIIQSLAKSKVDLNMDKYKGVIRKTLVKIFAVVGKLFSAKTLMRWQRRIAISNNRRITKNKCCYSYPYGDLKCLFPVEIYKEMVMVNFAHYQFPAPSGWHQLLTIIYGDYMTPPSSDKQVPIHGFENLIFLDKN